jgi:hypothetical protein
MLKTEGAVLLQGVLNQDEVDVARPHLARKHLEWSRNRTYLDSPYANLKNPVGRYEVLGDLSDEVERELVNTIMDSLSGILGIIVGLDGRINEFNYITQCKVGAQIKHTDFCGYEPVTDYNEDGYCNDYYSLILAMQHTPSELGGTEIWPGSHRKHRFWPSGKRLDDQNPTQAILNAGDALLYNQKLYHRGGQNFIHKARVMTVFVFASQGKGK